MIFRFVSCLLAGLVVMTLSTSTHADLIGYWQLNGDGNEASGNNIDLTVVGDAGFADSLHSGLGQALSLNGPTNGDDAGAIGSNFNFVVGNDISVVAWVNANSLPTWGSIAKNWAGATGQFHFGVGQGGADTLNNFLTQGGAGGFSIATDSSDLPLNQWVHVAFVADSVAGQQRIYLDGAEVSNVAYNGLLEQNPSINAFGIGNKPDDNGTVGALGEWDGLIDEVGIFDEVLSEQQIGQIITDAQNGIQLNGVMVPEPSTFLLTILALVGVSCRRYVARRPR